MRTLLLALLLVLWTVACGGGGGGFTPPDDGGPPPDDGGPPSTGDARSKEILQDCVVPALSDAADWIDIVQQVINGMGSGAGMQILPLGVEVIQDPDVSLLNINWSLVLGGDPREDGQGRFSFFDMAGGSVQPLLQSDLDSLVTSEDIDVLGTALPSVADGTRFLTEYSAPSATVRSANLDVAFQGGAPAAADGSIEVERVGCSVRMDWSGIPFANLQGNFSTTFPVGTWMLTIAAEADDMIGTIVLDGSSTAVASVVRNGGAAETWNIDLIAGVATFVP